MSLENSDKKPRLQAKVSEFPAAPGVYLFKDRAGRVLYVGKAVNLRPRVASYFQSGLPPRLGALMSRVEECEYMVTDSEVEALVLEAQLIKDYQPRYNVNLKDDKDYPYIKITGEMYPRLELVRLPEKKDKGEGPGYKEPQYFGPFTRVRPVRHTLRFMGRIFPLRKCRRFLDGTPQGKPCLNYQMNRCLAPCRGKEAVSPEEYGRLVEQATLFLQGKQQELVVDLENRMREAAENLDYEKAAVYRDRLYSLQSLNEPQKVHPPAAEDVDVFALVCEEADSGVQMLRIREGRLRGQDFFALRVSSGTPENEIMAGFIKNYYSRGVYPPSLVLLNMSTDEDGLLSEWLGGIRGQKVEMLVPRRGERKKLVDLCLRNGRLQLQERKNRDNYAAGAAGLEELQKLTGATPLERIEGYDISHLGGRETVGSMVVFQQGEPFKDGYRRFRIRGSGGGDDLASLREVLARRLDHRELPLPDLVLVDGGPTQLEAAAGVIKQKELEIPLLSLAKQKEEIYLPSQKAPLLLPNNHAALQLLQRIRDEAHRFAASYHRKLRERSASSSVLEKIPGIGKQRRSRLLQSFGGMENLMEALPEEIEKVPGFSRELAERVYRHLHR